MNQGYVFLYRSLMDNPLWYNSKHLHLAIYCLLKANHTRTVLPFNGVALTLERGQFVTGRHSMCLATGMSEQSVRTSLAYLTDRAQFLTIKSTNHYSVITVCKYDDYQTSGAAKQPTDQPAPNQRLTTDKNDKNEKKEDMWVAGNEHTLKEFALECNTTPTPESEFRQRLRALYGRRPTTRWSDKEFRVLKVVETAPDALEEIALIETHYAAMKGGPRDKDYRRRDIQTLLNNWTGAVDRARGYKPTYKPLL